MAYKALYREWRPNTFNDVVGQEHITTTIKNQIIKDRIAHAYLLCGTRGTGKTTTAKLMAKALNCLDLQEGEPCNKCEMCKKIDEGLAIDIAEMDAASNNKVEHMRELIDNVQYPPQEAKFKVYILDEAHMLTDSAVNAFLKTLEEPPSRVVFILATTDPQKLPVTILSRCQRFDFKRIRTEAVTERLKKIVDDKGVLADDKSLELIARISDGAMRDSISILDQAIAMGGGKVEYDCVVDMLGLVTNDSLLNLTETAINKDTPKAMKLIDDVVFSGKDINTFIKDFTNHMRNLLMVKVSNNPSEVLDMSLENIELIKTQATKISIEEIMRFIRILQDAEEQSKWSKQGRIYLELALIKMCRLEFDTSPEVMLSRLNYIQSKLDSGAYTINVESKLVDNQQSQNKNINENRPTKTVEVQRSKPTINEEVSFTSEGSAEGLQQVERKWKDILETFKARRMMVLYASLMTGRLVGYNNGEVYIKYTAQFSFNKQRLEKEENRRMVDSIFSEILRENVKVKYLIEQENKDKEISKEDKLKQAFDGIVEIYD